LLHDKWLMYESSMQKHNKSKGRVLNINDKTL
jgi:hypothetical protein